jgi:hypothetical protein
MPKLYRVIGTSEIHGFAPGQTFHADLEPAHEQRMFAAGNLELVLPPKKAAVAIVRPKPEPPKRVFGDDHKEE